jgi:Mor family transcriptional regulator
MNTAASRPRKPGNAKEQGLSITCDLVNAVEEAVGDREKATGAIRSLCRELGGNYFYFPRLKTKSGCADVLRGILSLTLDGENTEKALSKIMVLFGGFQYYIPFERKPFRKEIALEIYERYNSKNIRELCNFYHISFTCVYSLYKEGRRLKLSKEKKDGNQISNFRGSPHHGEG